MDRIIAINNAIKSERELLLQHPLYAQISEITDLRKFTEGHVYAVWDFMSLLKALQIQLTCTTVPWFASQYPTTRYLINEIVLAEESDEYLDGRRLSHFEMYLDAMERMGADASGVLTFLKQVQQDGDIFQSIDAALMDERIKDFLRFTFETIANGKPHEIASAFTFGREDLIPDMFSSILGEIQQRFPAVELTHFVYYFQRHIELDGDEHGPLAMKMIHELAGEDEQKWAEMTAIAKLALAKRIQLWDAILDSLAK